MKPINRSKTIILLLSLLCLLLFSAVLFLLYRNNYFASLRRMADKTSYDYKGNAQYMQRESLFELTEASEADLVFVGDSITARCEWQELFPEQKVLNRGIDSDVTEGVLHRLDVIIASNPKRIFVMIGINDIRQHIPLEATLSNYKQLLSRLKEALPDTGLYVQSVLPIGAQTGMSNDDVMRLNEGLAELADTVSVTYIDLYPLFADQENNLPLEYSIDGVHLTGEGYRIWQNAIKPFTY